MHSMRLGSHIAFQTRATANFDSSMVSMKLVPHLLFFQTRNISPRLFFFASLSVHHLQVWRHGLPLRFSFHKLARGCSSFYPRVCSHRILHLSDLNVESGFAPLVYRFYRNKYSPASLPLHQQFKLLSPKVAQFPTTLFKSRLTPLPVRCSSCLCRPR